jgi:hypothetical protein
MISEGPSQLDPALSDARIRKHICKDITGSGFFKAENMEPVKMSKVLSELRSPRYTDIFRRIYTSGAPRQNAIVNLLYPYMYSNPYSVLEFSVDGVQRGLVAEIRFREHVFACIVRNRYSRDLLAYYVSKEYNVLNNSYMPGRFVFRKNDDDHPSYARIIFSAIALAEEPATIYQRPNYNLELHYLRIRKHRRPGKISDNYIYTFTEIYAVQYRFLYFFAHFPPQQKTIVSILCVNFFRASS